jgi:potassium channel subfamily K
MVTVTTVGYGDLTPEDKPVSQMFLGFYAFVGVAFMAAILSELSSRFIRSVRKASRRAKIRAIAQSRNLLKTYSKTTESSRTLAIMAAKEKEAEAKWKWLKDAHAQAKMQFGILVDFVFILVQLGTMWSIGAAILMSTEGFTFVQSFYCSIVTSLSVGYGDFYPHTQGGRLAFAFYIPTSVSVVLGAVGQLLVLYRRMNLVHVVKRVHIDKIFELDTDGDGVVSKAEYVLCMLRETREVDEELLQGYESQFKALDTDGSGHLSAEDFPDELEIETTSVVLNKKKIESVIWKVVLKKGPYSKRQKASIANGNDSPTAATPPIAPFVFEETSPIAIGQKKVPLLNPAKGTSSSGGGETGVDDQLEGARESRVWV